MTLNTTLNGVELQARFKDAALFSQDLPDVFEPLSQASLEPLTEAGVDLRNLFDDQAYTPGGIPKKIPKGTPREILAKLNLAIGQLERGQRESGQLERGPLPQFSSAQQHVQQHVQQQPIRGLSDRLPVPQTEDMAASQEHTACNHAFCTHPACNTATGDRKSKKQPQPFEFNTFNPNVDERGGRFGKWSQPGGKGTPSNITYSFADNFGNLSGLSKPQAKSLFVDALEVWSDYAPLNFQEVKDSDGPNVVDIRVEGKYIDGPSRVLGRAFSPVGGDITFDSGDNWNASLFSETAVHEIGHSLGLTHEDDVAAIMNSSIKNRFRGQADPFLLQDDINGIRSLYGSGKGSVRTLGSTSPTPNPNPTPNPPPQPTPPKPAPNPNKNLVINGGFENASVGANQFGIFKQVKGWTTRRGPGIQIEKRRNLFGAASEGTAWAELDSSGNSAIKQTLDTVTGQNYTLSFDYSPRAGVSADSNRIGVYWNGKAIAKIKQKGGNRNQWDSFSFDVKGKKGRRSNLTFRALGPSDGAGGFIDNIVVKEAADVTADAYSLGTSEASQDAFVNGNALAQSFEVGASSSLGAEGFNPVVTL